MTSEELAGMPIGDRIAHVRKSLRLSQVAFAKRLGVSERTVKRWESSFIPPNLKNAEKIAALGGLPIELFFLEEGESEGGAILAQLASITGEVADLRATFERDAPAREEARGHLRAAADIHQKILGLLEKQTSLLAAISERVSQSDGKTTGKRPASRSRQ